MIYDSSIDDNPYQYDEIYNELMEREVPDPPEDTRLNETLDIYDCAYLIPYVHRVMRLAQVKEALGWMPPSYNLSQLDIDCLVILKEEQDKRTVFEQNQQRKQMEAESARAKGMAQTSGSVKRGRYGGR
jgi:hypothetical protein